MTGASANTDAYGADAWPSDAPAPALDIDAFRTLVLQRGIERYRDLPWRQTHDPYAIWVSEVMLQQTQVARVDGRWQRWMERFPTLEVLAMADQADVLEEWQGMGYNRRALALRRAAAQVVERGEGMPRDERSLTALPGIGPATAAGIRAFAFDLPGVYLETNVRAVFLHELCPGQTDVPDRRIIPLVAAACPTSDARGWYYALLDYGAWLKKVVPNPSRRSRTHARQSRFEGSHRQKRAQLVRLLLEAREQGVCASAAADHLGTDGISAEELLRELEGEGFCARRGTRWYA